jgi:ATP-dependent Clp protease ATP-binding subunit ClpC
MFERYTEKARRVIFYARYEAAMYGYSQIETEHLLLALFRESGHDWKSLLSDVEMDMIRDDIGNQAAPHKPIPYATEIRLSVESKQVLTLAAEEADRAERFLAYLHPRTIGTKHLMAGLLLTEHCRAVQILKARGMAVEKVLEAFRGRAELD